MKIAITLGDPAGIGPELILKAIPRFKNLKEIAIYGSKAMLKNTARDLHLLGNYQMIEDNIVDCVKSIKFEYGKPTKRTGEVAIGSINQALEGNPDILITLPIVKDVIRYIMPDFVGHTEYLAKFFQIRHYGMLGILGAKRILLLTTHMPLHNVRRRITPREVLKKILLLEWGLKKYFRLKNPTIGVSAFNPHAFEFSYGEDERIGIGIKMAQKIGIKAEGPYPADSLFNRKFDGFLAMFHDQAFVYLKSKKDGLNFTLGLPIIRLSPLYGAALDIAGKNNAASSGMIVALREGVRIYNNSLPVKYRIVDGYNLKEYNKKIKRRKNEKFKY